MNTHFNITIAQQKLQLSYINMEICADGGVTKTAGVGCENNQKRGEKDLLEVFSENIANSP